MFFGEGIQGGFPKWNNTSHKYLERQMWKCLHLQAAYGKIQLIHSAALPPGNQTWPSISRWFSNKKLHYLVAIVWGVPSQSCPTVAWQKCKSSSLAMPLASCKTSESGGRCRRSAPQLRGILHGFYSLHLQTYITYNYLILIKSNDGNHITNIQELGIEKINMLTNMDQWILIFPLSSFFHHSLEGPWHLLPMMCCFIRRASRWSKQTSVGLLEAHLKHARCSLRFMKVSIYKFNL